MSTLLSARFEDQLFRLLFSLVYLDYYSAVRAPVVLRFVPKSLPGLSSRFMTLFRSISLRNRADNLEQNNKNNYPLVLYEDGFSPAMKKESVSKMSQTNIPSDNKKTCPRNAGLCSSRQQAVDAFGGSARLSWSQPQSQSNLPKDPPSKTATLHKKDDTDTRIIFKSCGTACSLQRFQRLTANFPLSVCLCSTTNFNFSRHVFMRIQNIAQHGS